MTPSDPTGTGAGKRKHSSVENPGDALSSADIDGLPTPATKKPRITSPRLFKVNLATPQAQTGTQHSNHVNEMKVTRKSSHSEQREGNWWFLKELDAPCAAYTEALAAELCRWLGPELAPKVRVAPSQSTSSSGVSALIKKLPQFETAEEVSEKKKEEISALCENQLDRTAGLSVSVFCFEEYDLHRSNWGFTTTAGHSKRLVKIDHDCSFYSLKQPGLYAPLPQLKKLKKWPNLIYHPSESMVISLHDIEHLPMTRDFNPANSFQQDFPLISASQSVNINFIKWKFYYFTKFLLLTEGQIDAITTDFISEQSDPDIKQHAENIKTVILNRQTKISEALFHSETYYSFLDEHSFFIARTLEEETRNYNLEFIKKSEREEIKKSKAAATADLCRDGTKHRFVDAAKVRRLFKALVQCFKENKKDTAEIADFKCNEVLNRLKRSNHALYRLQGIPGASSNILEARIREDQQDLDTMPDALNRVANQAGQLELGDLNIVAKQAEKLDSDALNAIASQEADLDDHALSAVAKQAEKLDPAPLNAIVKLARYLDSDALNAVAKQAERLDPAALNAIASQEAGLDEHALSAVAKQAEELDLAALNAVAEQAERLDPAALGAVAEQAERLDPAALNAVAQYSYKLNETAFNKFLQQDKLGGETFNPIAVGSFYLDRALRSEGVIPFDEFDKSDKSDKFDDEILGILAWQAP